MEENKQFSINKFLERYKKVIPIDVVITNTLIKILKKRFNILIKKNQINYNNGVLYIKTSSNIKSGIFINKIKILNELNKSLKNNTVKDIR